MKASRILLSGAIGGSTQLVMFITYFLRLLFASMAEGRMRMVNHYTLLLIATILVTVIFCRLTYMYYQYCMKTGMEYKTSFRIIDIVLVVIINLLIMF